jgi:O-antigen/teichoic acid export membrane protein
MLVNVGVGLVQTLLLMSGNSRRHLIATVAGLALNVAGCLVLIRPFGALGAAIAWSLGIVCENLLAAHFARRALGEPLLSRRLLTSCAATVAVTGVAAVAGVGAAGRGIPGLVVSVGLLFAGCCAALGSERVRSAAGDVRHQLRRGNP